MTIEEAIEALSLLRIFDAPSLSEAVKMAVAALRYQADTSPNDPLTLEELREMDNDWVWIKLLVPLYRMCSGYYMKQEKFSGKDEFYCGYPGIAVRKLLYAGYGSDWLAYRRKPEEPAP